MDILWGSSSSKHSLYKTKIYIKMLDGSVIVDYTNICNVKDALVVVVLKHNIDVNKIEGVWSEKERIKPIRIYHAEPDFVKEYKKRVGESNGNC